MGIEEETLGWSPEERQAHTHKTYTLTLLNPVGIETIMVTGVFQFGHTSGVVEHAYNLNTWEVERSRRIRSSLLS